MTCIVDIGRVDDWIGRSESNCHGGWIAVSEPGLHARFFGRFFERSGRCCLPAVWGTIPLRVVTASAGYHHPSPRGDAGPAIHVPSAPHRRAEDFAW